VPPLGDIPQEEAESIARQLQRDIFNVVRARLGEIIDGSCDGDISKPTYLARFGYPIWNELLVLVYRAIGPRFCGQLALFNTKLPQPGLSAPALTRELSIALSQMPEVRGNPALHAQDAVEELVQRILPTVTGWASERCNNAITSQDQGTVEAWSPSVAKYVHARRLVFQSMVQALSSSPPPGPSNRPTGEAGTECSEPITPQSVNPNFRPVNLAPVNAPGSDPVLQSFGLNDMSSRRRAFRQAPPNQQAKPTIPGTQWAPPVTTMDRVHQSRISLPTKPLGEPAWMSRRPAARANRG
jgi:hypothetical protein